MHASSRLLTLCLFILLLGACGDRGGEESAASAAEPPVPMTNRIDVPPAVRKNLGITFAKVEERDVRSTIRVPGHFELRPDAHRAYHATLSGQVELRVKQYAPVKKGDVLFRVESPQWHSMQRELADTVSVIRKTRTEQNSLKARMEAVAGHAARLRDQRGVWQARLKQIEGIGAAGGGIASARTEARAELASTETALAEVVEEKAQLLGLQAGLGADLTGYRESTPLLYAEALGESALPPESAAQAPLDLALARAAALLGREVSYLLEDVGANGRPLPRWRALDRIDVVALQAGVVESLGVSNGAWIDVGQTVVETADPAMIRFRASGLQADLGRMRDDMDVRVLPPGGGSSSAKEALHGTMKISLEADPLGRKIDLVMTPKGTARPHWARRGVSTEMEIVLAGTPEPLLAVPVQAVIQDGLDKVIFRRDPKNPNKVIRLKADLGLSDGRWIIVESGFMAGDEVVHHGVYELMLASGGAKQKGGHFHSDGTFHEGDDH